MMETKDAMMGVGDHDALELLNSTTTQGGVTVELLPDGPGTLEWMQATGLIDAADELAITDLSGAGLERAVERLRDFREWLRPAIADWANGTDTAPAPVVSRLNDILRDDDLYLELNPQGTLSSRRRWRTPDQIVAPLAAAAADLFATGDRDLVRHCEGEDCTMWFYDRTKSHRRRWCSMAVCGNREKARAHRQRQSVLTT
jgi:predicted RNA-binding Zn ribbon-like protein